VLRAEEEVNQIEFAYLQSVVRLQVTQINLYKALGGNVTSSGMVLAAQDKETKKVVARSA
jgi:outer membrane protein TolC